MKPFGFLDLLSMPVRAVFTGKVRDAMVSRNPLHWVSLWGWMLLLGLLFVVLWPLYVVVVLVGGWFWIRNGNEVRIVESGLEVRRHKGGATTTYPWRDIAAVFLRDEPPGYYPVMALSNGEKVPLQLAKIDDIAGACEAHGIAVDRSPRLAEDEPG
jgi:hypothetical protein